MPPVAVMLAVKVTGLRAGAFGFEEVTVMIGVVKPTISGTLELLALKFESPLYAATMLWVPDVGSANEQEACPLVTSVAVQVAPVTESEKVTDPVGTASKGAVSVIEPASEICAL